MAEIQKRPTTKGYDGVSTLVREHKPFQTPLRQFMGGGKGRHIFAQWERGLYVVYAYGGHYPMYIYEPEIDKWYANEDKYSITTSRLKYRAHPGRIDESLDTRNMQHILSQGSTYERVKQKMLAPGGLSL